MLDKPARVASNEQLTEDLWSLTLVVEGVPELVLPGQFVALELGNRSEFMLRRPLSVYATYKDDRAHASCLELAYQVVGEGTRFLTTVKEGATLQLLGPLGQGWQPPPKAKRVLLVGGGVGWAPLAMLAGALRASGAEVHALMGAQNARTLRALAGFSACLALSSSTGEAPATTETTKEVALIGNEQRCFEHWATDDGSRGHHGFNTELLDSLCARYDFDYMATCGPEPMQKKVAGVSLKAGIPCEVSLERRMACGLGACLGCVVTTVGGTKRACADGPVFKAEEVCW